MGKEDRSRGRQGHPPPRALAEAYFEGRARAPTARDRIVAEVLSWPGTRAVWGRRGELSLKVGRAEIGHLHGETTAHFGFPQDVWDHLMALGRIVPHPLDRPGLAARRLVDEEDERAVIDLMRLNYERIVLRHGVPAGAVS